MIGLISPEYLEEQKRLHADPRGYGGRGAKWASVVFQLARELAPIDAVLDYGCGQNTLAIELGRRGLRTRSYDPAIEEFSRFPKAADLVVSTDVLEHVEPDRIDHVVKHLRELTKRRLFVVVSTVPTEKKLSDGRQAHICLHPAEWWEAKLGKQFELVEVYPHRPEKQFSALFKPRTP